MPRMLQRALVPVADRIRREFAFDVIDASFFYPDGPAAVALGRRFGVPVSIKARGADIHHWGTQRATAAQVVAAGRDADGLLAVSAAMRADMAAIGIPAEQDPRPPHRGRSGPLRTGRPRRGQGDVGRRPGRWWCRPAR